MSDVTRILSQIERGDPQATERLLPLVYDELRKLASEKLAQEKPGQTLQATALVHEAYLRLVPRNGNGHFEGRGHFFCAAAEAMRRILIDQARRKKTIKAGGEFRRVELDENEIEAPRPEFDLLELDEALQRLAALDHRKAELVKLRYFSGLTLDQAAAALGISTTTADADWAYAKSWLRLEVLGGSDRGSRE